MNKFVKSLPIFLTGLPVLAPKANTALPGDFPEAKPFDFEPVQLHPLNNDTDNLFAAHSSHSSHRSHSSHSSHYSSSGGGSSYSPPASAPTPPASSPNYNPGSSNGASSGSTGSVVEKSLKAAPETPAPQKQPQLTKDEQRMLQIMRVQMSLTRLGLYEGPIHGELDNTTKEALKLFQRVKGLQASGLMTTETLNALNVKAAN